MKRDLIENFKFVVMENYANFKGRARRHEFWMFILANLIISAICPVFAFLGKNMTMLIISGFVSLALFIPSIAVGVRRLHDTGKSGWFYLLVTIPIANLYVLYLFITDSQVGENKYGQDPKASER